MIGTVTNYVELQRVKGTAARTEFMGEGFQALLRQRGIQNAPIGVRNPKANAVCKRMHQVVGNVLLTINHTSPPQNTEQAYGMVDYALQTAAYAI